MKLKLILLGLFITLSLNCFSQFSKTHYIPPLSNSNSISIGKQFIYISTPSTTPISVQIKEIGGNIFNAVVSRNAPYEFNISTNSDNQLFISQPLVNTIVNNKGFIIEADDIVYVSVRIDSDDGNGISNQAGALVSKGLAALGTEFRVGGFLNLTTNYQSFHHTFVSVLATENNTEVFFSDIKPNAILVNGLQPNSIILNAGESYAIAVQGPTNANRDALIGSSVFSTKPVVVNCGSLGGTNSFQNLDYGFDQIVSVERTGKDYIFIKSTGSDITENALIIANEDFTEVYLNDNTSTTPNFTLNRGEYVQINGSFFNADGNLYVKTNNNVFAYQSVSNANVDDRNQELFFVPPLSCQTPKSIDNIPNIERIGNRNFTGRITITTKVGSLLNFIINENQYSLSSLPNGTIVIGPTAVTGNSEYECYTITGISGNVSVFSTSELYLAAYGSEQAATFGGYYSGFTFQPEITFQQLDVTQSSCIPNINLQVASLSGFDTFQWYYNNSLYTGPGANSNSINPSQPGNYFVKASLSTCNTVISLDSDIIPVSFCPEDTDNDGVNNNLDKDLDNDGIPNCTESYGDLNLDLSTPTQLSLISIGNYNNSFSTNIEFFSSNTGGNANYFSGFSDGSFISSTYELDNSNTYSLNFSEPISLVLKYVETANSLDLVNSDSEFILKTDSNKTITVENPTDQLLIDTNYDGVYESGVTKFSSFEIRFKLKGTIPLAAGSGTFSFKINKTSSIQFKHTNKSEVNSNNATFLIKATCIPKDTDGDGISDENDLDSDNDGIPDIIEAQGSTMLAISNIDTNGDGIDDAFGNGIIPVNSDSDSNPNYLDLDSDNDGIFDLFESGSNADDTNINGIIDGNFFGTNGLANGLETTVDSGILNFTISDNDSDGILNYIDLDSDNDGCNDVIEAGFTDLDNDGILGSNPITFSTDGLVINGTGYVSPNSNYSISAPIIINTQPLDYTTCQLESASFTIDSNPVNSYQWQLSIDGGTTWNDLNNTATYSGVNTITLTISSVAPTMVGYKYRVFLNKNGNSCGLYSAAATLTTYDLPVINSPLNLIQCDDDTDGFSYINLTQKNDFISANAANETFSYFYSFAAANTNDSTFQITNPIAYYTNDSTVWVRVVNSNGCPIVAQLNVFVSATQIPAGTEWTINKCDDYLDAVNDDKDGITYFDFSAVENDLLTNILPSTGNYSISFYKNQTDLAAEKNPITNSSNYRNNDNPYYQDIWVRVDRNLDNSCYGYALIHLIVNPVPNINLTDKKLICTNQPTFFVTIDAGIIDATPISDYTYQWFFNGTIINGETNYSLNVNTNGIYTVTITNIYGCTKTRTISVEPSDIAHIQTIDIVDLVDYNTVLVTVTGTGNYVYALDDQANYQTSNFFENVSIGNHVLYIRDNYGCGIVTEVIHVLGTPKYFTPNGDGINDTWNIKGISAESNAKSLIYIFDRYGKLLAQIDPLGNGWDGTYNGNIMNSDDYWFTVKFENGKSAKGHFSLKR